MSHPFPAQATVKRERGDDRLRVACVGVTGDGRLVAARLDLDGGEPNGDNDETGRGGLCCDWPRATSGPPRLLHGPVAAAPSRTDDASDAAPEAPPRCAAVAVARVGPALAVESFGRWCLVFVLETGDVLVYWADGATPGLRKLDHDFIGRPPHPGSPTGVLRPTCGPFVDVESRCGVFLGCGRPAVLVCDRGAPTILKIDAFATTTRTDDSADAARAGAAS